MLNRLTKGAHADTSNFQTAYGIGTAQTCSATTYGYGYSTVYTDEVGNKKQAFTDALGRLIEVDEPTPTAPAPSVNTCYTYDVLNNLLTVTQGTKTRQYAYDMLSRQTSATTPEAKGNTRHFYYTTTTSILCSGDPNAICRRLDELGNATFVRV